MKLTAQRLSLNYLEDDINLLPSYVRGQVLAFRSLGIAMPSQAEIQARHHAVGSPCVVDTQRGKEGL